MSRHARVEICESSNMHVCVLAHVSRVVVMGRDVVFWQYCFLMSCALLFFFFLFSSGKFGVVSVCRVVFARIVSCCHLWYASLHAQLIALHRFP